MLPQILISVSAATGLFAGTLHLHDTFFGPDLRPQDPELEARMKEVSPNITSQTTVWKAWIGFNAILSLGLMLFGLLYGYLAIFQCVILQQSPFLLLVGFIFLVSLIVLWRRHTFYLPVVVFSISLVLYVVGAAIAMAWPNNSFKPTPLRGAA